MLTARSAGCFAISLLLAIAACSSAAPPRRTLPAEFEPQGALVLSTDLTRFRPELLVALVAATHERIPVVMLVRSIEDRDEAIAVLAPHGLGDAARFVYAEHESMWVRDFGPISVRQSGGAVSFIDTVYSADRSLDDAIPSRLGSLLSVPVVSTALRIDGGNLVSNGAGLVLTTDRAVSRNTNGDRDAQAALGELTQLIGARKVVVLKPLVGEPTGHVDMIATFTAIDTIVIASLNPKLDPENAALLDLNAESLANVRTAAGPLKVVRVPMSRDVDGTWHSSTNVIYANGTLLVPVYADAAIAETERVLATFGELLPTWTVKPIDATAVARTGGSLHCITRELTIDADSLAHLAAQPFLAPPRPAPPNPLAELARVRGSYTRKLPH